MVYEDEAWQEFLEQIIRLVARHGYKYFSLSKYPLEKKSFKCDATDKKLTTKYRAEATSMQRYRGKKKGFCAYYYLRWKEYIVILKTPGQVPPGIIQDDAFFSIAKHSLKIRISAFITVEIFERDGKISAKLADETYWELKNKLFYVANSAQKARNPQQLIEAFKKLNGLPCWRGILQQKSRLKRYCLSLAKKRGLKLHSNDLHFRILRHANKKMAN
ncbi:hypothetical protein [Pelosinus propionicus]|uniref:Uncharacterized protein n=1 Tax=Pelosinus propionicus DSM 13327 TaxID=1123291 RepID=A0A1I4LJ71_9FIRM|nr:hypothetical protein [Pelosinus propionicus]SFL91022.1 hypothetical protein SAMN04490355_102523 [Pelosinus propionicus DSM 13327]